MHTLHPDSLCCASLLHMPLSGLLLRAGWKQDAAERLLLAYIHLHQDPVAYWSHCLVLQAVGDFSQRNEGNRTVQRLKFSMGPHPVIHG